jgi:flagellar basal body-associated protein FliL
MIKFIVAGLWLCAVTIGAVFYSFSTSSTSAAPEPEPALLGGLDYVKTEVLSVPVLKKGGIVGYFLARFVYTVDPKKMQKLSAPANALIADELYTYLFSNPNIDFTEVASLDIDAMRAGVRDAINKRVGEEFVHDVIIEQIDFLSKEQIRDNTIRRRTGGSDSGKKAAKADHGSEPAAEEAPAH